MTRIRTLGIVCFALCFTAILGGVLGYAFRRPAAVAPKNEETVRLSIPPEALNVGDVWEDERFAWTVLIENQEPVPVEMTSFSHTCNCLSIKPESLVLKPGERRELYMEIDLTQQTKPNGEVFVRLFPRLKTTPGTELAKKRLPQWYSEGASPARAGVESFGLFGTAFGIVATVAGAGNPT